MQLENITIDALAPSVLGQFWGAALGLDILTDTPTLYEARLTVPDGPWLDLCLPKVEEQPSGEPRMHLDLAGGETTVRRLLDLGATRLDVGHDVSWTVLADPEGNPFCVRDEALDVRGPIAAVRLDSADPGRDARFWEGLTGWDRDGTTLVHPSGRGPVLTFWPERSAKTTKNRLHLDVRADPGEDLVGQALKTGASRVEHGWGELPWTVLADPSGNELCVMTTDAS